MVRPIQGPPSNTRANITSILSDMGAPPIARDYANALFTLAPITALDPVVMLGQAHLETGGFTSPYCLNDGNFAGIGIWKSGVPSPFSVHDGATAAQIHSAVMLLRVHPGFDLTKLTKLSGVKGLGDYVAKVIALWNTPDAPKVRTTGDLNIRFGPNNRECSWACDDQYTDKLDQRMALFLKGAPTVASNPSNIDVPGLAGGPVLGATYAVIIDLIDPAHTLQRPGILLSGEPRSVQHETANPNSDALGEAQFFKNGAGGNQESAHCVVDETGVRVIVPYDEVTWQAADGGGPGNMSGRSQELTVRSALINNPTLARRSRFIAADWQGRVSAHEGIAKPEQHWSFNWVECCDGPCDVQCGNRHPCPEYLRSIPGAWDQYVKDWTAAKQDELQRMGKAPAPAPGIDWSKFHKPVPIPALSKTDVNKNDTAPGIQSSEGTDFVFISDVLEPLEDVDRLAVGDRSSAKTGPKIAKGERFLAAWLFKAISGPDKDCYFALTPAPFWTRVIYRDAEGKMYVKRVADAPLKGTP